MQQLRNIVISALTRDIHPDEGREVLLNPIPLAHSLCGGLGTTEQTGERAKSRQLTIGKMWDRSNLIDKKCLVENGS